MLLICLNFKAQREHLTISSNLHGELASILPTFLSSTFLLNGLIIFRFSLFGLGVAIVAELQNCCPCPYFRKVWRVWPSVNPHTIFPPTEPFTRIWRILEVTTDQGDDNHWAGVNERHQTIYLNFLDLTKIVLIGKHKQQKPIFID